MKNAFNEVYATFQTMAKGGSGRGQSFYANAAGCGRRAHLQELAREAEEQDREEKDYFAIGSAYHLLHQIAPQTASGLEGAFDLTDRQVDDNFIEALRLYRGWCSLWGTMEQKYGPVVGTEVPGTTEFGGEPFTGKLDAIVRIDDLAGVRSRTGLLLLEPGLYIIDHKTARGANDNHAWQYTQGLQGRGYLHLYPEAKGIIFDVLYKHKSGFRHEPLMSKDGKSVRAGKSYEHFLQLRQPDDIDILHQLVSIGASNYHASRANPAECFKGRDPCFFFTSGKCSGI